MSITTSQPLRNWTNIKDTKAMTASVCELPALDIKPEIKVIITPLPYDERLRKFLDRPTGKGPDSEATSTVSIPAPTAKEQDERLALPTEALAAVPHIKEPESRTVLQERRAYLSRRERLSIWWKQERAEQKAAFNALAPYIVF